MAAIEAEKYPEQRRKYLGIASVAVRSCDSAGEGEAQDHKCQ